MRAVVTGGAGFIGGHIARALVADGHDVRCFDNLSDGRPENVPGEAELIEADLRDPDAVAAAAKGADVVFHQAALRSVPRSLKTPDETTDVNVRGTLNVLLAARDAGSRVVSASSSSVYGDQETLPLEEGMYPRPRSPYAASKAAGEHYCLAFTRCWDVPTVSLRYFNVYGPGQDPASEYAAVVPRFILACLTGTRPEVHGDGEQSRDFTFIDDVVDANLRSAAAREDAWGLAFNIGAGGEPTSVNALLAEIARLTGAHPDPIHAPSRPGDIRHTKADISRARTLLGYSPRWTVPDGLARTVAAFRTDTA